MEEIIIKINDLFEISNTEIKVGTNSYKELVLKMKQQDDIINELKNIARAKNTLLGRIIKFPHEDGFAYYIITKVNKRFVKIVWIDYCDGWLDDNAGKETNLDINYAKKEVNAEDMLDKLFVTHSY